MKKALSIMLMISMLLSMFCALPFGAAAEGSATIPTAVGNNYPLNKTATALNGDMTDVTLTVPGTVEGNIDVVLLLGGGMQANKETVYSAINLFKPLMESGKSTVKLGLISLERGEEIIVDLADDEAVLNPRTYEQFIEEKFAYISSLPTGSTNLHSQLVEAKKMLDADTEVDAGNKYLFVIATGRTYYFDDVNGNQATIVNKTTVSGKDYYYYGNYLWQSQRGGHTSLYMIPDRYNNNWDAYWADVCKWVEADGDEYVYTLPIDKNDNASFETWSKNNNNEIRALAGTSSRFGLGIVNPVPTAADFVTGKMNAIGDANNPQHALNYERAQYEAAKAYKALVDEGYNCYALCSETALYQNNSEYIEGIGYKGTSTMQLGHSFMNYLASLSGQKEAPTLWDFERDEEGNFVSANQYLQEDFFTPIAEDILYTCSKGSTIVDYIGKNENGNFEFIEDADYIKLNIGGVNYITAQVETAKHTDENGEIAKSSYAFTAPGASEPTFWLDYYYGNGKTTERFVWTFGENVSMARLASLTYKLLLTEKQEEAGTYIVPTNNSATLYPIDSDGNPGDPEDFPIPEVDYEVIAKDFSAIIKGKKVFDRNLRDGMFDFVLKEDGKVVATASNDENGNFSFSLKLDEPGVYEYTVEEIDDGNSSIVFDHSVYNVTVTANKDGTTKVEYESDIVFYNETVQPVKVYIPGCKYLDGNAAAGFEFALTDQYGNTYYAVSDENGYFVFEVEYDGEGYYSYTVSEIVGDNANIEYDDTVYNVTVDVSFNGNKALIASVALKHTAAIEFNNTTIPEVTEPEETTEVPEETTEAPEETTEAPEETTEAPEETTEVPEETTEVPEVTTEPEEEITEEPTPLDPAPETTEPEEEITDPEVPLNPKTGDSTVIIVIAAIAVISLAVIYFKRRQTTEE